MQRCRGTIACEQSALVFQYLYIRPLKLHVGSQFIKYPLVSANKYCVVLMKSCVNCLLRLNIVNYD